MTHAAGNPSAAAMDVVTLPSTVPSLAVARLHGVAKDERTRTGIVPAAKLGDAEAVDDGDALCVAASEAEEDKDGDDETVANSDAEGNADAEGDAGDDVVTDGDADGEADGDADVEANGEADGEADGETAGDSDGAADGDSEGDMDAEPVAEDDAVAEDEPVAEGVIEKEKDASRRRRLGGLLIASWRGPHEAGASRRAKMRSSLPVLPATASSALASRRT